MILKFKFYNIFMYHERLFQLSFGGDCFILFQNFISSVISYVNTVHLDHIHPLLPHKSSQECPNPLQNRVSLYSLAWSGVPYINLTSLELMVIFLPLPPKCLDYHCTWLPIYCFSVTLKCKVRETGKVTQWLGAHTVLTEYPSLVPNTHIRQLTMTCNSSPRSKALFWLPQAMAFGCTKLHTDICIHN